MPAPVVTSRSYLGIFLVTLATLMYEILLTRIFSVTMWYHFAFMAISIAMFGMTVGAILVYQFPKRFTVENAKSQLGWMSFWFGVTIIATFFIYLQIPQNIANTALDNFVIPITFPLIAVPFVFSGLAATIALTKFPRQVSRIYAADLAGAGAGCIALLVVMKFTDAYTAVLLCALLSFVGGVAFARDEAEPSAKLRKLVVVLKVLSVLVGIFCVVNTGLARKQQGLIRLTHIKGWQETSRPMYEKWNSFSRITVGGDPNHETTPFGWGYSPTLPDDIRVNQLNMTIDSAAGTVLMRYDGDPGSLDYLRYDISNLAHHLREDGDILVVGVGGGRDILSALAFGQRTVTGVELNDAIVKTITRVPFFHEFTGRLDQIPGVRIVVDEARSFVARTDETFDIIQVSMIDTWAATAAGAFVLSENALYTREGWGIFLDHLNDRGLLTYTRWFSQLTPFESYRLVSLASTSLQERGVTDTRQHILMAAILLLDNEATGGAQGISTILVSPTPFTDEDVDRFERVCEELQFEILLSPRHARDDTIAQLADGDARGPLLDELPVNLAAPTDNNPFFFNMLRFRDMFKWRDIDEAMMINYSAVWVLGILLATVVALSALCIILPLVMTTKRGGLKGAAPFFVFFSGIGMGFMLIEIALLQRLIIFLGHPTYSLAVVLFTILVASGLGSYTTDRITRENIASAGPKRLLGVLAVIIVMGFVAPVAAVHLESAATPIRIGAAFLMLFPLGLFMGMCFPLGMKMAGFRHEHLTPWLWGINGAMSVTASVLTVAISITFGIPAAYWAGFVCYIGVYLSFRYLSRRLAE